MPAGDTLLAPQHRMRQSTVIQIILDDAAFPGSMCAVYNK